MQCYGNYYGMDYNGLGAYEPPHSASVQRR